MHHRTVCKHCINEYNNKYHESNYDNYIGYQKKYRQQNRAHINDTSRERYWDNIGKH